MKNYQKKKIKNKNKTMTHTCKLQSFLSAFKWLVIVGNSRVKSSKPYQYLGRFKRYPCL